ncbi:MAG: hypothetical protein HZC17_04605 [Candidatus Omnitrophica bacterium]|nr:hypothetical protein [Candidatus Omnitrophota bacterium]
MIFRLLRAICCFFLILCLAGTGFPALPDHKANSPLVILIQENHSDVFAQKKLAELVSACQQRYGTRLLAVEGASGEIPVEELRNYSNTAAKKESSQVLLDQLILDGASYSAIFAPKPMRFVGVEDPDLYQANCKIFQAVKIERSAADQYLAKRRQILATDLKKSSPALKEFYGAGDDVKKLLILAEKHEVSTDDLLLKRAVSLCEVKAVRKIPSHLTIDFLLDHPEIRRALEAESMKRALSADQLALELRLLRNRLKKVLMVTDVECRVDHEKTELERLERMASLKAFREDLSEEIPPALEKAHEFYVLAKKRDAALAKNFLRELQGGPAILVTGGFHTAGIARILRENNISYRVMTPNCGKSNPNEALYERRLRGDFGIQTLAAPRPLANPEFRNKLIRLWDENAVSISAIAASLGEPFKPETTKFRKQTLLQRAQEILRLTMPWVIRLMRAASGSESAGLAEEKALFHKLRWVIEKEIQTRRCRASAKEKIQYEKIRAYLYSVRALPGNVSELKYLHAMLTKSERPIFLDYPEILNLDYVVLDFETTGLSAENDRVIEVTAICYHGFTEIERFTTLVSPEPGTRIPWVSSLITGITTDMLRYRWARPAKETFVELSKFLERNKEAIVVGHNIMFDLRFLKAEFKRFGLETQYYEFTSALPQALKIKRAGKSRIVLDTWGMAQSLFPTSDQLTKWVRDLQADLGLNQPFFTEEHVKNPPALANRKLSTLLGYLGVRGNLHRTVQDVAGDKIVFLVLAAMQMKRLNRIPEDEARGFVEDSAKTQEILRKMYPPQKDDHYITRKTSHGIFMGTDLEHIESVLDEIDPGPGMKALDLGAGDGRVVVAAALRGVESVGVEGDYKLTSALENKRRQFIRLSQREGVGKMLHFEKGDFFKQPFADYDIIFYSIGGTADESALEEKLIREMKPGAKFVVFTHVPVSRPYFENLKFLPLDKSVYHQTQRVFQIYEASVSVHLPDESELTQEKWLNAWNEKLQKGIVSFPAGDNPEKQLGKFNVHLAPARDLARRPRISDFRNVPAQNVFSARSGESNYWFGVNAFPFVPGHGMIYENLTATDISSPQLLTEKRLEDLLVFSLRYPFFKFFFNGGPKAGASVTAFHAHLITDIDLPVERWLKIKLLERTHVKISRLAGYPGTAIVFESGKINHRAYLASRFLDAANKNQIPYNVLIGESGIIYLFLRDRETENKELGSMEHAGSFQAQTPETFSRWKSEQVLENELANAALKEADFKKLFGPVVQALMPDKSYVSFTASSLGRKVNKILIAGPTRLTAALIKKIRIGGNLNIVHTIGAESTMDELVRAQYAGKPFDLVISFLKMEEDGWLTKAATADQFWRSSQEFFHRFDVEKTPFVVISAEEDTKDSRLIPLFKTFGEYDKKRPEGFFGFYRFALRGSWQEHFRLITSEIETKFANPRSSQAPPTDNPIYRDGIDGPPIGGRSLGQAFLNQVRRAQAWFDRSERVEDRVVFLVRKETLAELTPAEKNEINFHLAQQHRRLMILHDRADKDVNFMGLVGGNIQHWWGGAEDYVQVLRRAHHPHVIYLSAAAETRRFHEPGLVNVKHSLFAPTAAIEYLFQGKTDLYGIWKKENGRLELNLSEEVERLFQGIAAARWRAVSA